jgi:hypothetical protein
MTALVKRGATIVQPCVREGGEVPQSDPGCSIPAADGHLHKPEIDGCPFVPGRGW